MSVPCSIDNYLDNTIKLPTYSKSNQSERAVINNTHSGALALIISHIYKKYAGPILLISSDPQINENLERELNYFDKNINFLPFVDWETLPYDNFSPHPNIISQRIKSLYKISNTKKFLTSISLTTALHKLCLADFIQANSFSVQVGEVLDFEQIKIKLINYGYSNVTTVLMHGQFCTKGSILDIYPMGSQLPYRIDLFDTEIETIRVFDPDTQLSIEKVNKIEILPAYEFPCSKEAFTIFRNNWRTEFNINGLKSNIFQNISNGTIPPGIEYFIPLFYQNLNMDNIFTYLPEECLIIILDADNITQKIKEYIEFIKNRYNNYNVDSDNPLLSPERLFLNVENFYSLLKNFNVLEINSYSKNNKSWHQE